MHVKLWEFKKFIGKNIFGIELPWVWNFYSNKFMRLFSIIAIFLLDERGSKFKIVCNKFDKNIRNKPYLWQIEQALESLQWNLTILQVVKIW